VRKNVEIKYLEMERFSALVEEQGKGELLWQLFWADKEMSLKRG
jgi:hypothetical protein